MNFSNSNNNQFLQFLLDKSQISLLIIRLFLFFSKFKSNCLRSASENLCIKHLFKKTFFEFCQSYRHNQFVFFCKYSFNCNNLSKS